MSVWRLVRAIVYLLKQKDIIPDSVPLVGRVDDIAVLGFALKFVEPQLKEYAAWRDAKAAGAQAEEATAAPAEEAAPAETAEA